MNRRNILRTLAGTLFLWGVAIAVEQTRGVAYCVPEAGMTGFLHKALFAPAGNCTLKNGKCQNNGVCSFVNASGKTVNGKCTVPASGTGCTCQ